MIFFFQSDAVGAVTFKDHVNLVSVLYSATSSHSHNQQDFHVLNRILVS